LRNVTVVTADMAEFEVRDEVVMMAWVDGPLKAYVELAPDGIIPLLILASYR
jgi:hypothetical protein